MGILKIETQGSFKAESKTFGAIKHGHAHAVAEAIQFLSEVVLPDAIAQDHKLAEDRCYPEKGFTKDKG